MKKINQSLKKIYYKEKPLKTEWIIAGLIAVIMLIMFTYIDTKSLTIWSTNILDCLSEGNIKNYFKYTALNIHNAPHQFVSGTLYSLIPWAIWNIPIWFLQKFLNVDILNNSLSLLWSKLFLVVALILTLYYTYKLSNHLTLNKTKSKWVIFLSFTYLYTFVGVFYTGQNDILICLLGIIAIYYLITNKNNKYLFYIISGFAISIKYFFILPYVILILLLEKNIFKILKKISIGIIPTLVFNVICYNLPMFLESSSKGPADSILNRMLIGNIPILSGYNLSLFVMAFIILAFIAYTTNFSSENDKNHKIIYFVTASFILLLAFTKQEFYRPILLMPFIFLLFIINIKNFRLNLILETILSLTLMIAQCTNEYYFFSAIHSMKNSLLTDILNFNINTNTSPMVFFTKSFNDLTNVIGTISSTIAFTCLLLILFINYPYKKNILNRKEYKCERYIIWIRTLMILPILLYLIISYLR